MENLSSEVIAAVLPHLARRYGPCSAYAFGGGHEGVKGEGVARFRILVFTGRPVYNDPLNVADEVRRATGVAVALLVHRPQDLRTKDPCQRWFFHKVLRDGHRFCLDTARVPYLLGEVPVRDAEGARAYWLKCEAVAARYLEAADSDRLEVELVSVAMLHTAAQFVALGLVRVFLGYTPNRHGLRFLLELCGQFTNLVDEVFPRSGESAQRRLKMLCAPPSMLRYWNRLAANEEDLRLLYQGVATFLERATALAMSERNGLTQTHQP